jgi:hypothetical protein
MILFPLLINRKNRGFLHEEKQKRMQTRLQVFLAENVEPSQSDQSNQLINRFWSVHSTRHESRSTSTASDKSFYLMRIESLSEILSHQNFSDSYKHTSSFQSWLRSLHSSHLSSFMMLISSEKVDFFMSLIIDRKMSSLRTYVNKKILSLIEKNIDLSNVNVLTMLLDVDLVAIDSKKWALIWWIRCLIHKQISYVISRIRFNWSILILMSRNVHCNEHSLFANLVSNDTEWRN